MIKYDILLDVRVKNDTEKRNKKVVDKKTTKCYIKKVAQRAAEMFLEN